METNLIENYNQDISNVSKTCENQIINRNDIYVEIIDNKIDILKYINDNKDPESGAMSLFIGTTRKSFNDKEVLSLFYEFHPTMAISEMYKIAEKTKIEYNLNKIVLIHRIGEVKVTEESVLIITVSKHREESIKGTSIILEEVKRKVPIWKKEYYKVTNNAISNNNTENYYVWKENNTSIHYEK